VDVDLYTFTGNHHEIGLQQGRASRSLLEQAVRDLPTVRPIRLAKPRLIPIQLFLWLAKRQATKLLQDDITNCYPRQAERSKGIAEGGALDMSTLLLFQFMELLVSPGKSNYSVPGCTSLALEPRRTRSGETIIAKNFDYPNDFSPYHLTCISEPQGRYRTLGCSKVVLPGMLDGMNEHGLTVTYNYGYATDTPTHYAPISLVIQEMLETCKNVDEAVEFMTRAKRAGGALLTMGDPDGRIRSLEISSNHAVARPPVDGQIVNANHYRTEEMKRWEIPTDAIFSGKTPKEYHGLRVHESSERRLGRVQELLKEAEQLDEDAITTILRDHGEDNQPSNLTICQHGDFLGTTRSVLFYPKSRRIKVLYGNPCQNTYREFGF
jgi:hypothetical protein